MSRPGKLLAADAGVDGARRFRFTGLHARLQGADARHSSVQPVPTADDDVDVTTTHFSTALAELTERNLTANFTRYADDVRNHALSLPLLLRSRKLVVSKSCAALLAAAAEQPLAVEPIALCIAALARDLGPRYFLPHLPDTLAAFAAAFNGPAGAELLWDPDVALLPVFAALSSIAKSLARQLLADPAKTLLAAAPLLGHVHYRVRELAAQCLVGYLVKKCRQDDVRNALVAELLRAVERGALRDVAIEKLPVAHGAGAALYESLAAPGGALHPRAKQVLVAALNEMVQEDVDQSATLGRLAVVAHAVARLCIHAKSSTACAKQLVRTLIDCVVDDVREKRCEKVGRTLFLVRHCNRVLLGNPLLRSLQRKVDTTVLSAMKQFPDNQMVVYEGFSCLLTNMCRSRSNRGHGDENEIVKFLADSLKLFSLDTIRRLFDLLTADSVRAAVTEGNADVALVINFLCDSLSSDEEGLDRDVRAELRKYPAVAIVKQFASGVEAALEDLVKLPAERLLLNLKENPSSEESLAALNHLLHENNDESCLESLMSEGFDDIVHSLSKNLSSSSSVCRKNSALFLYRLFRVQLRFKDDETEEEKLIRVPDKFEQDDAMLVRSRLGEAISESCPDTLVFGAVSIVSLAPFDLDFVPVIKEILTRLGRNAKHLSPAALNALSHFCIGMFCVRFKPLWQGACELWGALAEANPEVAWTPMGHALRNTCTEVLNYYVAQRADGTPNDDDLDTGDENKLKDGADENNTRNASKPKSRKRPRSADIAADKSGIDKNGASGMRKSRKMQSIFVLMWILDEWKIGQVERKQTKSTLPSNNQVVYDGVLENSSVDVLTRHLQYVNVLCSFPKTTVKMRRFIVDDLYLKLSPALLSKKTGDRIVEQYGSLLEKMGGLKISESDKKREKRLQDRLLHDLTRPCSAAQAEIFRCLCASRSPELKLVKESLLRLISDKTFRDEAVLLTEKLSSSQREAGADNEPQLEFSDPAIDAVVRICFSKMRGNRQKFGARRSSAVSLACTSLPSEKSLPKLVDLILEGLEAVIDEASPLDSRKSAESTSVDLNKVVSELPDDKLCLGVLTSLDSLLRHGWSRIPDAEWRKIAVALSLILMKAKSSSTAQLIRSDSLSLLAMMMGKNSTLTGFVCLPVLRLASEMGSISSGAESVTSAPALLKFLASCFKAEDQSLLSGIVVTHKDVCEWAVRILGGQSSTVRTIELVKVVALRIVEERKNLLDVMESGSESEVKSCCDSLINALATAIRKRLSNLREENDLDWHRTKSNRDTLQLLMVILSATVKCADLDRDVVISLVDSLIFIINETKLYGPALVSSIEALEALVVRLEKQFSHASVEDKIVPALVPILSSSGYAKQIDVKVAVCKTIRKLRNPGLQMVSYIVNDAFAMNTSRLGEADLDTRSQAFNTFIGILKRALDGHLDSVGRVPIYIDNTDMTSSKSATKDNLFDVEKKSSAHWNKNICLFVVHASLSAIEDEDVSIRGTASHALHLLVQSIRVCNATESKDLIYEYSELLTEKCVSTSTVESRREYCKVVGSLVRSFSAGNETNVSDNRGTLLQSLSLICDKEDLEADFFENVAHLQVHRRGRSMRRMAKKLVEMNASKESFQSVSEGVCRFLFPLTMKIALDVSRGENSLVARSSRRSKQSKLSLYRDVVYSAVALNQVCSTFLSWQDYRKEVSGIVRKIPRETEEERSAVLYSLLVGFADSFPSNKFDDEESNEVNRTRTKFLSSFLIPKLISFISCGSFEGEVHITANNAKKEKTGSEDRSLVAKVFRAPVGIAAAKLVSRLPEESLSAVIPTLVTPLSNALRSRMHDIRNEAKKVLVQVVLLLGPKYFSYVLDQVLSALSGGFRKETIIFVIQSLLEGIREHRNGPGETRSFPIDDGVKKLCKAMVDELEEGLHASKSDYLNPNASESRLKETAHRAAKVAEVAQVLAELVDFPLSSRAVLKPFTDVLMAATSSKLIARVSDILNKIIVGFSKNGSLTSLDGLKLAYDLVHANMPTPNSFAVDGSTDNAHLREEFQPLIVDRKFSNSPGSHVLCELGWLLLSYLFSKGIVDADGKQTHHREAQSMIEPFVPELLLGMRSRYDTLTRLSLKCAQRVMRLPISSRRKLADVMAATTVEVLSRNLGVSMNRTAASKSMGSDNGLFNTCLRAGAVLIQEIGHHDETGIRKERVVALLQISRNTLDQGSVEARAAALALIKSTVSSRVALPEVYDTIEYVSKLAIRAQSTALRASCTGIVIQFLIHYPLGKRRIRQHLEFVVRNLSYEFPHGRQAAIGILVALCQQLPEKNLNLEAQYFFLSIAAVVAQDDDSQCRKAAANALRTIFMCVNDRSIVSSLLKMALTFVTGSSSDVNDDVDLVRVGAVTISMAAESEKLTREQLKTCCAKVAKAATESVTSEWEGLYSLLSCMEKLFNAQGDVVQLKERMEIQLELVPLWNTLEELLLHKREWIRLVCSRLLGCHLAAVGGRDAEVNAPDDSKLYCVLWARDGSLRKIAKSLCLEFEASELSEDLAKQSLKNLLCITNIVRRCPEAGNLSNVQTASDEDGVNRPLHWIIARVSGLCTRVGSEESAFLRRACGLRFLMQSVKWWGREVVDGRLKNFVEPIVQILESGEQTANTKAADVEGAEEDDDNEMEGDGLTTLAQALQEELTKTVGATDYFKTYQALASRRRAKKNERKRTVALEAAVDPEAAAKKKQRKTEKVAAKRRAARGGDATDRVLHADFKVFEDGERINLAEE